MLFIVFNNAHRVDLNIIFYHKPVTVYTPNSKNGIFDLNKWDAADCVK